MGDLTKNISRHELACNCGCGFDSMDFETIDMVQDACDHFAVKLGVEKVVLNLHSAARCFEYNNKPKNQGGVGSNKHSQHPLARAIDFSINGVSPRDVYLYLCAKYPNKYGLGNYTTFTHGDTRSGPAARW